MVGCKKNMKIVLKSVTDTDHTAAKGLVAKNSGFSLHAGMKQTPIKLMVFISGYVLGTGLGALGLGSSLIALSLWPVLWNAVGLLV